MVVAGEEGCRRVDSWVRRERVVAGDIGYRRDVWDSSREKGRCLRLDSACDTRLISKTTILHAPRCLMPTEKASPIRDLMKVLNAKLYHRVTYE